MQAGISNAARNSTRVHILCAGAWSVLIIGIDDTVLVWRPLPLWQILTLVAQITSRHAVI